MDLVNYPLYLENDPTGCFPPSVNDCVEASLDIQTLTQFGEKSGATFAFVASSVNYSLPFTYTDTAPMLDNLLGLKPRVPNSFSWSWGGGEPDPLGAQAVSSRSGLLASAATGISWIKARVLLLLRASAADRIMLKFASLGITVLISSGDEGSSGGVGCPQSAGPYNPPVTPDYPTMSEWATSVGKLRLSPLSFCWLGLTLDEMQAGCQLLPQASCIWLLWQDNRDRVDIPAPPRRYGADEKVCGRANH